MKQSTIIFGTLLFAFIMYITLRGQLPAYLNLFKSKAKSNTENPESPKAEVGNVLDKAEDLLNGAGSLIFI